MPGIYAVRRQVRENRLQHGYDDFAQASRPFVEAGQCWVWVRDGLVRGDAAYDVADAYLDVLYVDPDFEGKGIGTALLEQCCEDLRETGHAVAWLHTISGTRAEAFHRARGWIEHDDSDPMNLLFRKPLRDGGRGAPQYPARASEQ